MDNFKISGNIVDVVAGRIFKGSVEVSGSTILKVTEEDCPEQQYILPGLIDAHIHIESSMLIPSEFARLAVVHGTTGSVSDPHEIANVTGIPGIRFMIRNGLKVPFRFCFGAPSCVPATSFETSGARLGVKEVAELLEMKEIGYLSEMMNFPGVLVSDPEVMAKLDLARSAGKSVDGHAPGLRREDVRRYIEAGISTDHECFSREEALEKIGYGMKILIREGSAAKNFEALYSLIDEYPEMVMLCSDDKHPDDLVQGHINKIAARAISMGIDPVKVLRACTLNPVRHYGLSCGLLQPGDPADFITTFDLKEFTVTSTYINGIKVADQGHSLIAPVAETPFNNFHGNPIEPASLAVRAGKGRIRVIEAYDGQLITGEVLTDPKIENGLLVSDPENDILKMVVLNRYSTSYPAVGFIKSFGIREGAIASCVAHDSHNIVAVGDDDTMIAEAINMIIKNRGGISIAGKNQKLSLPLPFAGIMSGDNGYDVATLYGKIDQHAKRMGSRLHAPFMTLSFMALLVIPALKLSDKGLFDGRSFTFCNIMES